jgi:hypothetical protein
LLREKKNITGCLNVAVADATARYANTS